MTLQCLPLSYYNNQLLDLAQRDQEKTRQEYFDILAYSKQGASTKTDRSYIKTAYLPKLFCRSDVEKISEDFKLFTGILKKVVEHFFEDGEYRKKFQFTELEEKLVLSGRFERCFLPMARFDIFYNDEDKSYKFCELNTDGSSAMNEDRELNLGEEKYSSVYKEFKRLYKTSACELFDSWVREVRDLYFQIRKTDVLPRAAIVDFMECATSNEFKVFAEAFKKAGIDAVICDVRDLEYDKGILTDRLGRKIDVVYRRAVTSDVLAHFEEAENLIDAAGNDDVLLLGDFHTQIIHNKAMLVMLRDEDTYAFLSEKERRYIEEHVPYTKFYDIKDLEKVLSNKDQWVLKPADGYASKGVYVGVEYSEEDWKKVVADVPTTHYILQEYCEPYAVDNYGDTPRDEYGKRPYHHLTGVFLYNEKFAGIYSRASITKTFADKENEIALPTLIVEDESS